MYFWRIYRNYGFIYSICIDDNMGDFEMIKYLRKLEPFNKVENKSLTAEFIKTVARIKERNSKIVWTHFYLPKAIKNILDNGGYLLSPDNKQVQTLATSMMLADLANGELTEFYRFRETESEV